MSFVVLSFLTLSFSLSLIAQEKSFVILMCGYNNADWVVSSLDSVRTQKNSNYRIIYIDDASTDSTHEKVVAYCKEHSLSDRMCIIRNTTRHRKLANWYNAIHTLIDDHEIVVLLDADDRLAHTDVLHILNTVYVEKGCWFAYSQYKNDPPYIAKQWGITECGSSAPIPQKIRDALSYRNHTFIFMHLRTFYAWLFKQIAIADLISDTVEQYHNSFFPASNDLAIMFPMVEMATNHIQFVPEVLYIRNLYPDNIGFKIDNILQSQGSVEIRKKQKYSTLNEPRLSTSIKPRIDVLIFASSSDNLMKTLVSYKNQSITNIRFISIMIPARHRKKGGWLSYIQRSITIPCYFYDSNDELIALIEQYITTYKPHYLYIATQYSKLPDTIRDDIAVLSKTKADALSYDICHEQASVIVDGYAVLKYKQEYQHKAPLVLLSVPLHLHTLEHENDMVKFSFSDQTALLFPLSNKRTNCF